MSLKKIRKETGRLTTRVVKQVERSAKQVEAETRRIRDQTSTNLDHLAKDVKRVTGVDPKPIVKALSGPAHILVKIAEGHNLTEATTDWVVQQVDGAGQIAGVFGSDVEDLARTIVSYANVPLLVLVNLAGDTVEVVEGDEKLEDLLGSPLATLIRQAHAMYDAHAVPLPIELRVLLSSVVDPEVLRRARVVIDRTPDNVAGLANRLHHGGGRRHAVTLDDIIVFSAAPEANLAGYLHWVHELKHVEQYRNWGVLSFATNYTKEADKVEAAAKAAETEARPILENLISALA